MKQNIKRTYGHSEYIIGAILIQHGYPLAIPEMVM
jgi:hypothetical protein